jgi:hypothetical protein
MAAARPLAAVAMAADGPPSTTLCLYTQPWRLASAESTRRMQQELDALTASGHVLGHTFVHDQPLTAGDPVLTLRLTLPVPMPPMPDAPVSAALGNHAGAGVSHDDWVGAGTAPGVLRFIATGYFRGTLHDAVLYQRMCVFKSTVPRRHVTPAQCAEADAAVRAYIQSGALHPRTMRDPWPHGGDRGASWFQYGPSLVAAPEDVPRLARLFVALDPTLGQSPGGLAFM